MRLCELCSAIIIQGNVAIKIFDEEGNELDERLFRNQDNFDTNLALASDLEYLEVIYIYPMDLYQGQQWLVIELRESHEV
jgi:hypothetical protein